jgi:hypothetical protein
MNFNDETKKKDTKNRKEKKRDILGVGEIRPNK